MMQIVFIDVCRRLQIVGIAAKQGRVRNAANTVVRVKQVLGRRWHVVSAFKSTVMNSQINDIIKNMSSVNRTCK